MNRRQFFNKVATLTALGTALPALVIAKSLTPTPPNPNLLDMTGLKEKTKEAFKQAAHYSKNVKPTSPAERERVIKEQSPQYSGPYDGQDEYGQSFSSNGKPIQTPFQKKNNWEWVTPSTVESGEQFIITFFIEERTYPEPPWWGTQKYRSDVESFQTTYFLYVESCLTFYSGTLFSNGVPSFSLDHYV